MRLKFSQSLGSIPIDWSKKIPDSDRCQKGDKNDQHDDYRRPHGEKRVQHRDYMCDLGVKTGQVLAGHPVSLCSTYNLEVLQWWYDLAVKIFPVLLINSNPLVKKNSRFQYRAPPMFTT